MRRRSQLAVDVVLDRLGFRTDKESSSPRGTSITIGCMHRPLLLLLFEYLLKLLKFIRPFTTSVASSWESLDGRFVPGVGQWSNATQEVVHRLSVT